MMATVPEFPNLAVSARNPQPNIVLTSAETPGLFPQLAVSPIVQSADPQTPVFDLSPFAPLNTRKASFGQKDQPAENSFLAAGPGTPAKLEPTPRTTGNERKFAFFLLASDKEMRNWTNSTMFHSQDPRESLHGKGLPDAHGNGARHPAREIDRAARTLAKPLPLCRRKGSRIRASAIPQIIEGGAETVRTLSCWMRKSNRKLRVLSPVSVGVGSPAMAPVSAFTPETRRRRSGRPKYVLKAPRSNSQPNLPIPPIMCVPPTALISPKAKLREGSPGTCPHWYDRRPRLIINQYYRKNYAPMAPMLAHPTLNVRITVADLWCSSCLASTSSRGEPRSTVLERCKFDGGSTKGTKIARAHTDDRRETGMHGSSRVHRLARMKCALPRFVERELLAAKSLC